MAWQKGEVVLVSYPYTDLSASKAHPALVLSGDLCHSEEPDIVLGALTSNLAAATGPLNYVLNDWEAAAIKFPTAFKPVIATLEPSLIVHRIGTLSSQDLHEVIERVKMIFELPGSAAPGRPPDVPEERPPASTRPKTPSSSSSPAPT